VQQRKPIKYGEGSNTTERDATLYLRHNVGQIHVLDAGRLDRCDAAAAQYFIALVPARNVSMCVGMHEKKVVVR